MTKIRISIIIVSLLSLMAVPGFSQTNRTDQIIQFLNDGDDELAASKLLSALKFIGEDVSKLGDSETQVLWKTKEDGSFILEPKTSEDSIDRIIVTKFYTVKFKYKNSDVMKELVWQMNRKLNVASFSLDNDGDMKVQGYVCFLNNLDTALLKSFCTYYNIENAVIWIKIIDQNAIEYFE